VKELTIFEVFQMFGGKLRFPSGISQQVCCNLPAHPGADRRPSAHLYPDTQMIYCYVCGGPWNPIAHYSKMKEITYTESRAELVKLGFDATGFKGRTKRKELNLRKLSVLREQLNKDLFLGVKAVREYYKELEIK